jgi:hypothetical protein
VLALKSAQREQAALDVGEENEFNETVPQEEAQKEVKFEFENELTPVERYGMKFVETVNPVIDKNAFEEAHRQLEMEERQWEEGAKKWRQMDQVSAPDTIEDEISPLKYKPRGRKGRPRLKPETNNNNNEPNNNNKKKNNNDEENNEISNSGDLQ